MEFAIALPWWMLTLIAAAIAAIAWATYARTVVSLSPGRRAALVGLRALTLILLIACLLRPVRVLPPDGARDTVVPILVDASRSMSLADMDGTPRIEAAMALVRSTIRPGLDPRFNTEVLAFGSSLESVDDNVPQATAHQSDLSGALREVAERYRDRRVAAVVVLSDGGDTGAQDAAASVGGNIAPVYTVGIGAPRVVDDYEVTDVSAGEARLADSSVDITVAAVSRGRPGAFDLRLLENGRPIDLRRVTPAGDGSPVRAVFTVSPPASTPTVYTAEIPSAAGELAFENNRRSVLVEPPAPRRRVLMIEGAPGFEHSFIKRAIGLDPGLDVDSVVRKGRDVRGVATYFVQAAASRASRLASGFPQDRAALFGYHAVILANLEADALSRAQLQMLEEFVDVRGGGLLMLGAKSFLQQGYASTPLEQVLPLQSTDRGNGIVRTAARNTARLSVGLTPDGLAHPVMRIDETPEAVEKHWRSTPALAGVTALGALRPGAEALAVVQASDGARPLVAVQRYGQGRALVFAGEASWRWRMQMPSSDRTHELFWRQGVRWVAGVAPEPVSVAPIATSTLPGSTSPLTIAVRNEDFAAVRDSDVRVTVVRPGGGTEESVAPLSDPRTGQHTADLRFEDPGVYQVTASARRPEGLLGTATRSVLVGGVDLEMADPRLNEQVLQRVAVASGGSYLSAAEAGQLESVLAAAAQNAVPRLEDAWDTIWLFLMVIMLLGAEWTLRRRWGLR